MCIVLPGGEGKGIPCVHSHTGTYWHTNSLVFFFFYSLFLSFGGVGPSFHSILQIVVFSFTPEFVNNTTIKYRVKNVEPRCTHFAPVDIPDPALIQDCRTHFPGNCLLTGPLTP